MEPSHTPGQAAPRPSLLSPSGGKSPASARILDNLAGGVGVRVPANKRAARPLPIWFGVGVVAAVGLVVYGVVSQMPGDPVVVPVATQAPIVVPPVVVTTPAPVELEPSQAATITNDPQEPAPGDTTATADNQNVLSNALEKDVAPPPLALSRALESTPPTAALVHKKVAKPNTKTAARVPEKSPKAVKEASTPKASVPKSDRDVEILQVLVAHNAKRRAASASAPATDVKSPPQQ